MADPSSRSDVLAFKRADAGNEPGHHPHLSSLETAIVLALLNQINVLRAQLLLPEISISQARSEVVRLKRLIDELPDGT